VSGLGALPILGQPNPNEPRDIHLVGRYAMGTTWADNHGSIYPFDRLRADCPCGACGGLGELTPAMSWPDRIQRTPAALRIDWSDGHQSEYPYAQLRALCRCAGCTGGH
jgi:DUF971 family protein